MSTFRIFGFSLLMTVVALVTGYLHGGPTALFLLAVLALLEVSLSFDNAIINAAILQRMSPFWQRMFLTIGILIAVFGMRLVLVLAGALLTHSSDQRGTVLIAGLLGMVTYLVVNGISRAFRPAGLGEATPGVQARQAAGKAGCALFLYLEVLDAAFSFDGVTGAFAITTDPIIIALGLGVVGAMFVRSITIYLVRQDTLDRYVYLEHGAHWAIGALAIILLLSIDHRFAVPEWVTASVGVVFIGAAFTESVRRNRLTVRSPTKFGS